MQRYKLLKKLYHDRLLGACYFDDIKPTKPINDIVSDLDNFEKLKQKVYSCHLCELSKSRKNIVFGEGDESANLMFVGEAPGFYEDESGRPFVGRAGELLTKIINTVLELDRSQVYIANIVKCRPPNNATPTLEIANMCKGYLFKQIELVNPKIIVALGSTAYKYLTNDMQTNISKIRGSVIDFDGIKLIPTYHPSFLLRNPSAKRDVFNDMKKVRAML